MKTRLAFMEGIVKSFFPADDADRMWELVLAKESAQKSQEDMTDQSAELVECLLENIDLSDARDFSSLGERVESRSSVKRAKKWMSYYKEKLDEIDVPLDLKVSLWFSMKDTFVLYEYHVLWVQTYNSRHWFI